MGTGYLTTAHSGPSKTWLFGGARRDRTADLLHAMQALSQLSYSPSVSTLGRDGHSKRRVRNCQCFEILIFQRWRESSDTILSFTDSK